MFFFGNRKYKKQFHHHPRFDNRVERRALLQENIDVKAPRKKNQTSYFIFRLKYHKACIKLGKDIKLCNEINTRKKET